MNSIKNRPTTSLPSHIDSGDCLISDHNEVCLAFNKRFAEAGHLFEKEYTGPPLISDDCVYTMNQAFQFSFQPFSASVVFETL